MIKVRTVLRSNKWTNGLRHADKINMTLPWFLKPDGEKNREVNFIKAIHAIHHNVKALFKSSQSEDPPESWIPGPS